MSGAYGLHETKIEFSSKVDIKLGNWLRDKWQLEIRIYRVQLVYNSKYPVIGYYTSSTKRILLALTGLV